MKYEPRQPEKDSIQTAGGRRQNRGKLANLHCLRAAMLVALTVAAWAQANLSPGWQPTNQEKRSADAQYIARAREESSRGDVAAAVASLTKALEFSPDSAELLRWRGREYFRLGEIQKSVDDFDRVAKLAPADEKTLWERGISLYYVGEFARGAKQFELYQTYHDADVENATWRYLCLARSAGVEAARKSLLPIKDDRRVPMMEIYALYQGEGTIDAIFAPCEQGEPEKEELHQRLFYAHLYVGLHFEAAGDEAKAREHITKAAKAYRISHYMGDVAHIHAARLAAAQKPEKED